MFTILYKTILYSFHLDASPEYEAGQIMTFCGDRYVRLCTSNDVPCGFAVRGSNEIYMGMGRGDTIAVAGFGGAEYITDMFEPSDYLINDFLYCSDQGKLTNEANHPNASVIGIVNSVKPEQLGFVAINIVQSVKQVNRATKSPNNNILQTKKYNSKFHFLFE